MSDPYVGEIRIAAFPFAPAGWALCEGQILPITDYRELFHMLGTTYGGDGKETFALPDLRGRAPVHVREATELGEYGGSETVQLTADQIPEHSHQVAASKNLGNSRSPDGAVFAVENGDPAYRVPVTSDALTTLDPDTVGSAGGSQPHNNMQPFTTVNFIIATKGRFPDKTSEIALFSDITNGGVDVQDPVEKAGQVTLTYTVVNSEPFKVILLSPSATDGVNVDVAVINGSQTIEPGGVAEFQVVYWPIGAGAFSFICSLSFKKWSERQFPATYTTSFKVSGTVEIPHISVFKVDGTKIQYNGEDFQGTVQAGKPEKILYTIRNDAPAGGGDLELQDPEIDNGSLINIDNISVTPVSKSELQPGEPGIFSVAYTTAEPGGFSFKVLIPNNTPSLDPFSYTVRGMASQNLSEIENRSNSGIPQAPFLQTDRAGLRLAADKKPEIQPASHPAVSPAPSDSRDIPNEDRFALYADTSLEHIPRNLSGNSRQGYTQGIDSGANSFHESDPAFVTSALERNGAAEEDRLDISVLAPIRNDSAFAQMGTWAGQVKTVVVSIMATGASSVGFSTATSSNLSNIRNVAIGDPGKNSLDPLQSTSFIVRYIPEASGPYSFDVSLTNSSIDLNPYTFTISGEATPSPFPPGMTSISDTFPVSGEISNGGSDFQGEVEAGRITELAYIIKNTQNSALEISEFSVSNAMNIQFIRLFQPDIKTLPAGGSERLRIECVPMEPGPFSLDVLMPGNGTSAVPYVFTICGTAVSTENKEGA